MEVETRPVVKMPKSASPRLKAAFMDLFLPAIEGAPVNAASCSADNVRHEPSAPYASNRRRQPEALKKISRACSWVMSRYQGMVARPDDTCRRADSTYTHEAVDPDAHRPSQYGSRRLAVATLGWTPWESRP